MFLISTKAIFVFLIYLLINLSEEKYKIPERIRPFSGRLPHLNRTVIPITLFNIKLFRNVIMNKDEIQQSMCGNNWHSSRCSPCCADARIKTRCDCSLLQAKSDCLEHYKDGMVVTGFYRIRINNARVIEVFCDQDIDNGGWTVMQRRINGKLNFYRDWEHYKNGFGNLNEELWMGNENIYHLTNQNPFNNELRIAMEDWSGNKVYAKYSDFRIGNEEARYKLHVNGYHGDAGDGMSYHNGRSFSTFDVDNDEFERHCAVECSGAWWYKRCLTSNLNGKYYDHALIKDFRYGTGVHWMPLKSVNYSLKSVVMMFRRTSYIYKDYSFIRYRQ